MQSDCEIFTLESITDEQWGDIRRLAAQIMDSGQFQMDGDQVRVSIAAFVMWLSRQPMDFAIPIENGEEGAPPSTKH